jgi:O-antigen/teichoic acid export membrane protein
MRNLVPSLDQAARNLIASWIYKILSAASAFLLTGWATRVFGLDAMGIVILTNGIVAYLMLLDFGASSALPRMLPRFLASRNQARADELLSTATIFLLPMAIGVLLLSPLIAHLVVRFAMIPATLREAAFWVMCVSVAAAGIAVPFRLGFGMLGCVSRFDLFFVYEVAGLALKLALAGGVLAAGLSLPWYAAAVAIPPVFVALAQFAAGLRSMRPGKIQVSLFRSWALAALLSMCGASLVMSFASAMTTQGGTLLIGAFGAARDVALFGFPLILVTTAMSLAGPFGAFLSPIVNALHGTQETQRMRLIVVVAVRLATALAGLIAAGLVIVGPAVLPLWLGQRSDSQRLCPARR